MGGAGDAQRDARGKANACTPQRQRLARRMPLPIGSIACVGIWQAQGFS